MGEEEPASCATTSVPVMVMLPLDTVNADGVFRYASSKWFLPAIRQLAATGIHGVAVDVWVSGSRGGSGWTCMGIFCWPGHLEAC